MKKYFALAIIALATGSFFSYPYIRHHWAIYQLHKMGIDLKSPVTSDAETMRKFEEQNFVNAACSANPEVLTLLLKTRFDVNLQRENGMTALHCAAADGKLLQVRLLLDRGANFSTRAKIGSGSTAGFDFAPIHLAAAWHHMDVVELLKSRGANINEPSEAGTPLMIALAVRRQERFAPPDGAFPGEPDLLGVYQAFQRMGADFGVVDGEGNTLFHVAMKSLRRPLIEAMLASGSFDLNLPNKVGDTPFMNFVRSAGYAQSADGRSGVTTDLDLIAQLIAKGANVNMRNSNGYAVILHTALRADLFDLLVQHGADVFVADNSGNTIWSELNYAPPPRVISFTDKLTVLKTPMKMDGKPGNGPLHVFARQSQPELVEYFLRRGVSPNERNDWLNTPLHQALGASGYGSTDIGGTKVELCVMKLLDAGADPNARNLSDETPLMIAGRHSVVIVRMLLAKGADVNAVAKAGSKNKHVLDYFSEKHNLEGFEVLVKAGASKAK